MALDQSYDGATRAMGVIGFVIAVVVRVAVAVIWTTVAFCLFTGHTIPVVDYDVERSIGGFLVWLVIGGPILFFLAGIAVKVIVLPFAVVMGIATSRTPLP